MCKVTAKMNFEFLNLNLYYSYYLLLQLTSKYFKYIEITG